MSAGKKKTLTVTQTGSPIGTHSGQNGASSIAARCICYRMKQYIHGWALMMDQGSAFDLHIMPCTTSFEQHMVIAWRD